MIRKYWAVARFTSLTNSLALRILPTTIVRSHAGLQTRGSAMASREHTIFCLPSELTRLTHAALCVLLLGAAPVIAQPAPSDPQPPPQMDDAVRQMGNDPRLKNLPTEKQRDLVEFVVGNMLFVAFHELGHTHVSELGLPVLGREEDAADSFATLALLKMGTTFSTQVLVQAARGWFLTDRRDRELKKRML